MDMDLVIQRLQTREVVIGDIPLGGKNPIRIQSMTTTDTMDTQGTIAQALRMVQSGSEYVRITAPSKKEAENLRNIRDGLHKRGCKVPLIADIHFTPNAAEIAARIVEKVRVNPGNYADRKKFEEIIYSDDSYNSELQRIYERFSPLVKICRQEGTAMRIGTNHGSLSDRILSRYGDTPLGMVESAMEFIRICEDHGFYDIVISMKASNPQVMVQAYRMLGTNMLDRGILYPLHLGVTEAGEGEDGRIKSALGIATLLADGMGDTVRVSLTEEPEYESPVAKYLVDLIAAANRTKSGSGETADAIVALRNYPAGLDPFSFGRRKTQSITNVGGGQVPVVVADFSKGAVTRERLSEAGYLYKPEPDKFDFSESSADIIYFGQQVPPFELPGSLIPVFDFESWKDLSNRQRGSPFFRSYSEFMNAGFVHDKINFIAWKEEELPQFIEAAVLILETAGHGAVWEWRRQIFKLMAMNNRNPVILKTSFPDGYDFYEEGKIPPEYRVEKAAKPQLWLSSMVSTAVVDGILDGLWLEDSNQAGVNTMFGILQLGRLRTTRTEYISCPSCGRTLFNLQETTAMIRKHTEHLKGVKIGIMGCIVNGPGEMADADYGYVGVGPDKIALYRGKEVVEKGVPAQQAVDRLIELIREDGNWVEQ